MKTTKKLITIYAVIITFIITALPTAFAKDYSDYSQRFWDVTDDHWAFEYISELTDKNVISGYEDGSFKPNNTVSRAEWAKMMVIAAELNTNVADNYSIADVNNTDWYYNYIIAAKDYMNWYNSGNGLAFKPSQAASREDVTVSLVKLKGYDISKPDYTALSQFKDSNSISNSLKQYVAVAIEKDLISGFEDNTFRGQDTLTRAEAAALLCRAFQFGNDNKVVDDIDLPTVDIPVNNTNNSSTPVDNTDNSDNNDRNNSNNDGNNGGNINNNNTNNNTNNNVFNITINPLTGLPVTNNNENSTGGNNAAGVINTPQTEYPQYATGTGLRVETLADASVVLNTEYIRKGMHYTQDNNNNLYYYDYNTKDIVQINMLTKGKTILANSDTLSVSYNGSKYNKMLAVDGIFYDNYINSLVVYGGFSAGASYFGQSAGEFKCLVELNTLNVIPYDVIFNNDGKGLTSGWSGIDNYSIHGTLNNGNYLVSCVPDNMINDWTSNDYIINRKTYKTEEILFEHGMFAMSNVYADYNNYLYYNDTRQGDLIKYDYNDEQTILQDTKVVSLKNNKVYVLYADCIVIYDINGNLINEIYFDDINLTDGNRINADYINHMILPTTNDDIIFYDSFTNSFRAIYLN